MLETYEVLRMIERLRESIKNLSRESIKFSKENCSTVWSGEMGLSAPIMKGNTEEEIGWQQQFFAELIHIDTIAKILHNYEVKTS